MFYFMYIFKLSYLESFKKISVSKKHTLMNNAAIASLTYAKVVLVLYITKAYRPLSKELVLNYVTVWNIDEARRKKK